MGDIMNDSTTTNNIALLQTLPITKYRLDSQRHLPATYITTLCLVIPNCSLDTL